MRCERPPRPVARHFMRALTHRCSEMDVLKDLDHKNIVKFYVCLSACCVHSLRLYRLNDLQEWFE